MKDDVEQRRRWLPPGVSVSDEKLAAVDAEIEQEWSQEDAAIAAGLGKAEPLFPLPDRTGERGGTTATVEEGVAVLETQKGSEIARVCGAIMQHALNHPEVHADDVAHLEVSSRNVIGAAFRDLVKEGLIEKTGGRKRTEQKAGHGRSSYVYRATATGREMGHYLIEAAA